jgi:DHA1 family multidrug resistance protein-like MFS transporter
MLIPRIHQSSTASIPGLIEETGISHIQAILGLSLFVFGYGVGPLFLAPLQETPAIGRSPVYLATLFLFVLFNVGAVLVNNLPGLLVFRLLSGFVGSPALATGGESKSFRLFTLT